MSWKRKLLSLILIFTLSVCACAPAEPERKQYTASFLTLFDTVTTIVGRAESEEAFQEKAQRIHDELLYYHQLFDIYNSYEGMNNLKTVNDQAGIAPVVVDRAVIDLLADSKEYYSLTNGRVNIAMGSVLSLWHDARSDGEDDPLNAYLPEEAKLLEASDHTSIDDIVIDFQASTVYLADPQMRLDVGAVAKGWSAQRVAESLESGLLISVGGNVCATGPKDADGTPWVIGIDNPDGEGYLHTVYVSQGSVVTSGDYQRWYIVGDTLYHHIIDPDSLYPARYWKSVTIVCEDSGLADALSTALFLLPYEEGLAVLHQCDAEALWMDQDGKLFYSTGFRDLIKT